VPEEDRTEKEQVASQFGTVPRPKLEVSEEEDYVERGTATPPTPLWLYS
jgi:hypothetical protein